MPLNEFKQRQIGTIRTQMYQLKRSEGEETLKREVKLTHLKKKIDLKKPPNCSNTNFSLHFKVILKARTDLKIQRTNTTQIL